MRHFYAGTFINRDDLKNVGIEYPIKLEYYKTKPSIDVIKNENDIKYGIEVVKTSYDHENISTENIEIAEFTKDEQIVNRILDTLTEIKEDGYFKRGTYGELSEEQEFRNYDKALMWLDKGIIPGFLKEDIKEYMNKSKNKIATDNHKQLTHN